MSPVILSQYMSISSNLRAPGNTYRALNRCFQTGNSRLLQPRQPQFDELHWRLPVDLVSKVTTATLRLHIASACLVLRPLSWDTGDSIDDPEQVRSPFGETSFRPPQSSAWLYMYMQVSVGRLRQMHRWRINGILDEEETSRSHCRYLVIDEMRAH